MDTVNAHSEAAEVVPTITDNDREVTDSHVSDCESEQALIMDTPEQIDDTPSASNMPSPLPSTLLKPDSPASIRRCGIIINKML